MVLSPQSFYNVDTNQDIFNHGNIQFWEYAQHGYDAIGFISCTGERTASSQSLLSLGLAQTFCLDSQSNLSHADTAVLSSRPSRRSDAWPRRMQVPIF